MKKLFDALAKVLEWLGGSMVLVMTLTTLINVIMRYIFKHSLAFSEELCRFLFIYLTFFGAALLTYRRDHLFVEVLFNRFRGGLKKAMQLLIDLVTLVFSAFMIHSSLLLVEKSSAHASTVMKLPMSYVAVSLLIGFALMTLFGIYNVALDAKALAVRGDGTEDDGWLY